MIVADRGRNSNATISGRVVFGFNFELLEE